MSESLKPGVVTGDDYLKLVSAAKMENMLFQQLMWLEQIRSTQLWKLLRKIIRIL